MELELQSDGRAVAFGLLCASSAFLILLGGPYLPVFLPAAVLLAFVFSIAPAFVVYVVGILAARVLRGEARPAVAAAGTFLGGAVALGGSLVFPGLFLFVGWYLFPWTFAYAAAVLPHLLHRRSARGRAVALHLGVATALYAPWIGFTLFQAFDLTAEMAGAREGAGWIENFPSAIVLFLLYGLLIAATMIGIRSPKPTPGS